MCHRKLINILMIVVINSLDQSDKAMYFFSMPVFSRSYCLLSGEALVRASGRYFLKIRTNFFFPGCESIISDCMLKKLNFPLPSVCLLYLCACVPFRRVETSWTQRRLTVGDGSGRCSMSGSSVLTQRRPLSSQPSSITAWSERGEKHPRSSPAHPVPLPPTRVRLDCLCVTNS